MSIIARLLLVMLFLGALTLPAAAAPSPPYTVYAPLTMGRPLPNYRIAFSTGAELWTVRADGTERTQLIAAAPYPYFAPSTPIWSPDGTTLAFWGRTVLSYTASLSTTGIYTIPADGHQRPRLRYALTNWNSAYVQWSPDGQYLAVTEVATSESPEAGQGVTVLRADGREPHRVSGNLANPQGVQWSPDSTQLVFSAGAVSTSRALYLVNRDGTQLHQVTPPGTVGTPRWSPNSKQVAITVYESDYDYTSDVYLVNRDGTNLQRLLHQASDPAWSPDGTELAYTSSAGIARLNLATHQSTVITSIDGTPIWSPDGTQLAFDGGNILFVIRRDGTQQRIISRRAEGGWSSSQWSPDGTRVLAYFTSVANYHGMDVLATDGRIDPLFEFDGFGGWSPRE